MGSGTAAASGTAAPGWLWDLERDRIERKIIQLLYNCMTHLPIFSVFKQQEVINRKLSPNITGLVFANV